MDFGGLLLLGLLWVVFNAWSKEPARSSRPAPSGSPLPPVPPPEPGDRDPAGRQPARALRGSWRGRWRRPSRARAAGPRRRRTPLPSAEEVEERESLEVGARSREPGDRGVDRAERARVDQDDGADAAGRAGGSRRPKRGAGRSPGPTIAAFDQRIRQEPADATPRSERFTPEAAPRRGGLAGDPGPADRPPAGRRV